MSKSKALVVASKAPAVAKADPFARHIVHLKDFHRAAMMASFQSVAAAIFTGLELLAVQAELKKCNSCTFKEWLSNHQNELGFSERTAFNYTKLAHGMQKRVGEAESLIYLAPSDLNTDQQKRLLKALHKSVPDDGTLNALYLDYGIVKKKHGHALKDAQRGESDDAPAVPKAPEQMFFDDIYLPLVGGDGTTKTIWEQFDDVIKSWHKKLPLGNEKVPTWQHADHKKLRALVDEMERKKAVMDTKYADMLKQAREALGRK